MLLGQPEAQLPAVSLSDVLPIRPEVLLEARRAGNKELEHNSCHCKGSSRGARSIQFFTCSMPGDL